MLDFDINKLNGLQVLLVAASVSLAFLGVFFGYIWIKKKWRERRGKLNTQNSTLTL